MTKIQEGSTGRNHVGYHVVVHVVEVDVICGRRETDVGSKSRVIVGQLRRRRGGRRSRIEPSVIDGRLEVDEEVDGAKVDEAKVE